MLITCPQPLPCLISVGVHLALHLGARHAKVDVNHCLDGLIARDNRHLANLRIFSLHRLVEFKLFHDGCLGGCVLEVGEVEEEGACTVPLGELPTKDVDGLHVGVLCFGDDDLGHAHLVVSLNHTRIVLGEKVRSSTGAEGA